MTRGVRLEVGRGLPDPHAADQHGLRHAVWQVAHLIRFAIQAPASLDIARKGAAIADALPFCPVPIAPSSSTLSDLDAKLWITHHRRRRADGVRRTDETKRGEQEQC